MKNLPSMKVWKKIQFEKIISVLYSVGHDRNHEFDRNKT